MVKLSRLTAIALTLIMVVSLTACGGKKESADKADSTNTSVSDQKDQKKQKRKTSLMKKSKLNSFH